MKSPGFFTVPRGLFDEARFNDKLDRRSAFLWLVERAAWQRTTVDVGGREVVLERGQILVSHAYLARAWRWDKSAVRRFLTSLKKAGLADIGADTGADIGADTPRTRITICDFERFQGAREASDAGGDTAADTGADRKVKKGKKDGVVAIAPTPSARSTRADDSQKAIRLPDDWLPPEPDRQLAVNLGLNPDKVAAEFRDYWRGVVGAKGLKAGLLGWSATYRNRCRELADRQQSKAKPERASTPEVIGRLQFEGRASR